MMFYKLRLILANYHATLVSQHYHVAEVYHANDRKTNKKKITSSKLFLIFILLDFLTIQLFCMWFMATYPEYGDLGSFIGIAVAIVGQVGVILGFFKKSAVENTVGGIVYETAMKETKVDTESAVG